MLVIILVVIFVLAILYRKGKQAEKKERIEEEKRNQLRIEQSNKEREYQNKIRKYTAGFGELIKTLQSELKHAPRNQIKELVFSDRVGNSSNSIQYLFFKEVREISRKREESDFHLNAKDGWYIFPAYGNHFEFFIKMIALDIKHELRPSLLDHQALFYGTSTTPKLSDSRVIKEALLKACEKFEERTKKEKEELLKECKKREQFLQEKKKFERTIFLNNGAIKLEAKYSESKDLYETSISLEEAIDEIISFAIKSGFNRKDKYSRIILFAHTAFNKNNIDYFFNFWHYRLVILIENKSCSLNNIKYINYIDDNEYMSWDYLSFDFLNHSWHFNLSIRLSFTILKEGESPHNDYMLRRSDFGPNSLNHKSFILAQYIISQGQITFDNWLNKASKNGGKKTSLSQFADSDDFINFSIAFNKKWNFNHY